MNHTSKLFIILFAFFLFSWAHRSQQNSNAVYERLREGFSNPTAEARPKAYWWWLNGNVDTAKLMDELSAMKDVGVGGVDIFDIGARAPNNPDKMIPAGPAFMDRQSLATIIKVIKKATEYNMEVGLNLASSWNAGGSWIKPEHAGKSLYRSTITVEGPGQKKAIVPFPEISALDEKGKKRVIVYDANGKPVYYKEVVVLALPADKAPGYHDTSRIINVSGYFNGSNNELTWNVPPGKWEIQRYVCSNSGEQLKYYSDSSAGPIIDHFDSTATRVHFMHFINLLQPVLGDFRKTALKNFYLASFEATGSVWTESLPVEFKKLNGYDVYKLMPSLFSKQVFDSLVNRRFKHDFDFAISELMIRNHYGKAKEIANNYGLKLISESGGPGPPLHNVPVEGIKALGALDIPRGEFWNRHAVYDQDSIDLLMLVKEVSAAAHMYHRKIVEEESFTSFQHWTEGPSDLRPLGDRAFCEGMNRVVIHGFSHNPAKYGYPGIVYHAGTHFNNKNLWWSKAKPFTDYLSRISYIMQETKFVSDVLYYYGDKVPNFVTPKNTRFAVAPGYDYDIINTDVLLRELSVKNGMLVLPGGASFRILYLGNMEEANLDVVKKLKELVAQGAIITGVKPSGAIGLLNQPGADKAMNKLANEIWADEGTAFMPGLASNRKILNDTKPVTILRTFQIVPDFNYKDSETGLLDFIHQEKDNLHIYFIRNTTDQRVSRLCSFRQHNKIPEIWDPVSGSVYPVNIFNDSVKQVSIPITLSPYQSYFVVFRDQKPGAHHKAIVDATGNPPFINYTSAGMEILERGTFDLQTKNTRQKIAAAPDSMLIEGTWKLTFAKGWGAPDSVTVPALTSWTESAINGIRYFSGTGTYGKVFRYNKAGSDNRNQVYLDLGDLSKIAEVWLNGESLGITWTKPYAFDITGKVKNGDNTLKIEVVNTWSNRLAGDAVTGEKFTSTNLGRGSQGVAWAQSPLIRSGLFGPVTIIKRRLL
ncbi:MAG: glycosyl hydrolase [Chitinophagaceae bacterium]